MQWFNEPPFWTADDNTISVQAAGQTDFWRITHDGGQRDNGHLYGQSIGGDFTAEVKISGEYTALYDQAGLMIRLDDRTWLKCGVEFVTGVQYASVVVTREYSDWSVIPLPESPPALWLRVTRHEATIEVHYSTDGVAYTMLRQAYLTPEPVQVGVMVAAPTGEGFRATFEGFAVREL